jgi:succinyl-CoA synthetase alpha subunit
MAKAVSKNLNVTPVVKQVVKALQRKNHLELEPEDVENTVRSAVREAVKDSVKEATKKAIQNTVETTEAVPLGSK